MANVKGHNLKTWKEYFQAIQDGKKNFELRKNDRDFKVGKILILEEYDPDTSEHTGRAIHASIEYILEDGHQFGLVDGYVVMGINAFLGENEDGHALKI